MLWASFIYINSYIVTSPKGEKSTPIWGHTYVLAIVNTYWRIRIFFRCAVTLPSTTETETERNRRTMSRIRLVLCIAILIKRNIAQSNSSLSNHSSQLAAEEGMDSPPANLLHPTADASAGDDSLGGVGGGAINEKTRYYRPSVGWNPTDNLGHMLHALVGLDRYPNYLNRFKDLSDIDSLENALETKLLEVRRQRLEIIKRRKDAQQLVKRYLLSENDYVVDVSGDCPCSALWRDHPKLSSPKTWIELRERKMLTEHAFKVAHHSTASTRKARKTNTGKPTKADSSTMKTKGELDVHSVGDIIDGKVHVQLNQSVLENFLCQEMFDVYSFPLLTNEVCNDTILVLPDIGCIVH